MNVLLALCLVALQPAALWCRSVDAPVGAPPAPSPGMPAASASPPSSESESESWESQEAAATPPRRNNIAELLLPLIERGLSAERRPIHAKKVIQVLPLRASKERAPWPRLSSRKKHVVEITPLRTKGRDGKPLAYILSPAKSDPRRPYAKRVDRHHATHPHKDHSTHHSHKKPPKAVSTSSSSEEASEEVNKSVSVEFTDEDLTDESTDKSDNKALHLESASDEPSAEWSDEKSGSEESAPDASSPASLNFENDNSKSLSDIYGNFASGKLDSDVNTSDLTDGSASEYDSAHEGSSEYLTAEGPSSESGDDKIASKDSSSDNAVTAEEPSSESNSEDADLSKKQPQETPPASKPGGENKQQKGSGPDIDKIQPTSSVNETHPETNADEISRTQAEDAEDGSKNLESKDENKQTKGTNEGASRRVGETRDEKKHTADNRDEHVHSKSHYEDLLSRKELAEKSLSKKSYAIVNDVVQTKNSLVKPAEPSQDEIHRNVARSGGNIGGQYNDTHTSKEIVSERNHAKNEHEDNTHVKGHHERRHYKEEAEYYRTEHKFGTDGSEAKQKIDKKQLDEVARFNKPESKQANSAEVTAKKHKGHVDRDSLEVQGKANEYKPIENRAKSPNAEDKDEAVTAEDKDEAVTAENKDEAVAAEDKDEAVTAENKDETVTAEDKDEAVTGEDKDKAVTAEDKNEAVTAEDKDEAVTAEDKDEAVTAENKDEAVTAQDKDDAVTADYKDEAVTGEDKDETVSAEDKDEAVTAEDKNEAVTAEDKDEVVSDEDNDEAVTAEDKDEAITAEDKDEAVSAEDKDEAVTAEVEDETRVAPLSEISKNKIGAGKNSQSKAEPAMESEEEHKVVGIGRSGDERPSENLTSETYGENQPKKKEKNRSGQASQTKKDKILSKVSSAEENVTNEKLDTITSEVPPAVLEQGPVLRTEELEHIKSILDELQSTSAAPDYRHNDIVITQQDSLNKLWEPRARDIIELIQSSGEGEHAPPPHCDNSRRADKTTEHTHEHKSYRLSFLFNK